MLVTRWRIYTDVHVALWVYSQKSNHKVQGLSLSYALYSSHSLILCIKMLDTLCSNFYDYSPTL